MRTAAADRGRAAGTAAGPLAALAAAAAEQQGGAGRARVGLCVLCGLPAAGKSTLARALRRRLPQHPGWACALLAYDELIPPEAFCPREPEAGPAAPSPLLPRWKRSRRELLQCLERFLRALVTGGPLSAPATATQPAWERFLACCRGQGLLSSAEGHAGAGPYWTQAAASRPLYLILDDNFYYQSMRYEVYQLARKYSLSFCQLFLECPLECCLQRNRLRSHPLPDQTIYLMARKIEMPDLKKNAWERNSLVLKSFDCTSEDKYATGLTLGFSLSAVFINSEQIISLLATALENPVKQNEENTEQKEADRATCAASTVHQADQTCRRIISQTMKDAKDKNVLPGEMKSLSEELNKLKAEFLEDLRQGNNLKNQICIQTLLKTSKRYRFLLWGLVPFLPPVPMLWDRNTVYCTVFDFEDQANNKPSLDFKFHRIVGEVSLGGTPGSHLVLFAAYSGINVKLDQLSRSLLQLRF